MIFRNVPLPNCLGKGGIPAPHPPVIAGDPSTGMPVVDGAGTLTLFLGDNAVKRQNVPNNPDGVANNTDDSMTPETWQVTHEEGDPDDTLTIKACGVTQKAAGVKKVVAVGHLASETISIDESVAADVDLTGGDKADQLTYLGRGAARLDGSGDDLLIGGTYLNSQDLDAVAAVLAEWTSSDSYSQRLANLHNGVGANSQYMLNTLTLFDDFTVDYLTGDKDQDWFWAFATDRTDEKGNETLN